jgi:hypothetical protein
LAAWRLGCLLNREGARDAKGVFCGFILILEEKPRIKIPKPCGRENARGQPKCVGRDAHHA